jgi:hypothetical protein
MMHHQLPTDADRQKAKDLRAKLASGVNMTSPELDALRALEQWIAEADAPPPPKPQTFKFIGR